MNYKKIKHLAEAVLKNKTAEEMVNFLKGILTSKEIMEMSTRLEIVKMLKKGIPQRVIAEKIGVGVATITRGSKELQMGRFRNV